MNISAALAASLLLALPLAAASSEKSNTKEEMKALILEDAKKAAKAPAPAPKSAPNPAPASTLAKTEPSVVSPTSSVAAADAKTPTELEGKLPQVEVNKNKVTVLEHELHEQDRKMAFEAKNATATELDKALNSPAVNPTILGGYSTKVRTGLAQERLELMEFEKELTTAIARAKTKEEKADLKKQLEDIRTMRRTLDSTGERSDRKDR